MTEKLFGTPIDESGVRGYFAKPGGGPAPLVIVFMEIWGVNDHMRLVCEKLAGFGFAAFALDFYDGVVFDPRAGFEPAAAKLKSLGDEAIMDALARAMGFFKTRKDVVTDRLGVIGFCNGGRLAFLAATRHPHDIGAAVCFYGGGIDNPQDRLGRSSVLGGVPRLEAPLLLCYGAQDPSIRPDEHARIAEALGSANKRYTLSVFPDVGHAFMDKAGGAEERATEIGWRMARNFLTGTLIEKS
ncbi:MAG: dienelactone hydrolase family protein [Acidiferrobacter sp.]